MTSKSKLESEKAFGSVKWKFLVEVLQKFGFGNDFIKWVELCNTNIESSVGNAGLNTAWFKILRGVREGFLLLTLLFILIAEILAQNVRNNEHIQGIQIGNKEHKTLQFAYDTTCILRNEKVFC